MKSLFKWQLQFDIKLLLLLDSISQFSSVQINPWTLYELENIFSLILTGTSTPPISNELHLSSKLSFFKEKISIFSSFIFSISNSLK